MGIRKHGKAARGKVRLNGSETLKDVAERLYHDLRLLPLLVDLNPGLLPLQTPAANTIVVVPSKAEAQQFAARMGFSLGFDPAKGGGTEQKRAWNRMQVGNVKQESAVDPVKLAELFASQSLQPEVAARRARALLSEAAIASFLEVDHDDENCAQLAMALSREGEQATVAKWLALLSSAFANVGSPLGRLALVDAAANRPNELNEVLTAALVVPKLQEDLIAKAAEVLALILQARSLASLDELQQEASLQGCDEPEKEILLALARAHEKGLPLLDNERLELLGLARQMDALERHFTQLAATFRRVLGRVERAPSELLQAVLRGNEQAQTPRPWPVVVKIAFRLAPRVQLHHADVLNAGLKALLPPVVDGTPEIVLNAGELAAKAVHNAVVAEAFDAVPERLAPAICSLLPLLRPIAPDAGPEAQVRQRRKSHFEKACLAPKDTSGDPLMVGQLFDQLYKNKDLLDDDLQKKLKNLGGIRHALVRLAERTTSPIPVLVNSASDLGRTLLMAAIALDAEWGRSLNRPEGLELAASLLGKHGTRALTLATQNFMQSSQRV
ncbi:MAG: hypothetical protein GY822_14590 [Deltaproteobacteria bacterium]|nr:hypothetical protein [Deltaproteobacteria bacterium]